MLYPAELQAHRILLHCTEKKLPCQPDFTAPFVSFFIRHGIYCQECVSKGGFIMRETDDPYADLEDLLFDEDAGGPSER